MKKNFVGPGTPVKGENAAAVLIIIGVVSTTDSATKEKLFCRVCRQCFGGRGGGGGRSATVLGVADLARRVVVHVCVLSGLPSSVWI